MNTTIYHEIFDIIGNFNWTEETLKEYRNSSASKEIGEEILSLMESPLFAKVISTNYESFQALQTLCKDSNFHNEWIELTGSHLNALPIFLRKESCDNCDDFAKYIQTKQEHLYEITMLEIQEISFDRDLDIQKHYESMEKENAKMLRILDRFDSSIAIGSRDAIALRGFLEAIILMEDTIAETAEFKKFIQDNKLDLQSILQ